MAAMTFTSAAAVLAFLGAASAFPQFGQPNVARQADAHQWIAPGPGDVRSPCPGTNVLANHGYIPRSGRGVSKQQYIDGFQAAFNFDPSGTTAGANNAINLCSQLTGRTCQTFDLDMLNTPHQIEHDASLTRLDREMAGNLQSDNAHFNAGVWERTKQAFGDATHIDYSLSNTARMNRIAEAKTDDAPGWFIENDGGSLAEHAFTFGCMADESSPAADGSPRYRLDWVDFWFKNEQLPTALGWRKPNAPIMGGALNSMAGRVANAPTVTPPRSRTTLAAPATTDHNPSPPETTATATTMPVNKPYPSLSGSRWRNSSMPVSKPAYQTTVMDYTTTTVVVPATPTSLAPYQSAEASKTSSAEAIATQIAGSAPPPLNAYNETHSSKQWKDVQDATNSYCSHVGSIANGIIGTWGNQGSLGSGSNPINFGGMGSSGAAAGSSPNNGALLCFCSA